MELEPLALQVVGFTKRFGSLVANDQIDLEVRRGEVHALLGENGAGKTTLMNCVYGVYHPDEGRLFRNGKEIFIRSPSDALKNGIGMVHQHFMLVDRFTVAENLVLGYEPQNWGFLLNRKKAEEAVLQMGQRYGLKVDPKAVIEDISVGAQQKVEILKALYRGAEILILDEPTAVLTPQEIQDLGKIIRSLCAEGKSVILITHKLNEILAMADRCTVIRKGKKIATLEVGQTSKDELASLMVGRQVQWHLPRKNFQPGEVLLRLEDLMVKDYRGLLAVKGLSFEVRAGEILAIAGVEGNGQAELLDYLCGLRRAEKGRMVIGAQVFEKPNPNALRVAGMNAIPEDRQRKGLVLEFSIEENLVLDKVHLPQFSQRGFLNVQSITQNAQVQIQKYDIRPTNSKTYVGELSGGNQQKVVIGRALSQNLRVIIAAQPTRGLDVGAIEFVHRALLEQRDLGHAILLISFELDEVLELADRILVLYEGQSQGVFERNEASEEILGRAMAGALHV